MKKALIRVRMSEKDVHYGGGIINMAKILELVGDCATELGVMRGGDEGLLAAYEHIEQYHPVFAGDYIEVWGWLSRLGNTSARFEVEVLKVIEPIDKEGQCKYLEPPLLVARATGIGVIPKEVDRGLQIPAEEMPLILNEGPPWWEKK
mgnify:CR=1 FL=1